VFWARCSFLNIRKDEKRFEKKSIDENKQTPTMDDPIDPILQNVVYI
jgi:hypothetical protein